MDETNQRGGLTFKSTRYAKHSEKEGETINQTVQT